MVVHTNFCTNISAKQDQISWNEMGSSSAFMMDGFHVEDSRIVWNWWKTYLRQNQNKDRNSWPNILTWVPELSRSFVT